MKKIEAIVRPERLEPLKDALVAAKGNSMAGPSMSAAAKSS